MNDRHFSDFYLAGFTYYDGVEVFQELKIGSKLILKAEPENRFDPNAVAVFYNKIMLGYIPKGENKQVSQLLNLGYTELFEARINRISPESHTEKQIGIVLRINKKEK